MKLSIKLSKAGILYTLLSIFLGISAVNTGNNLLYVVVSFLLSFMWLSGVFAKLNLKGLEVEIIPPRECYARKKALIKVLLKKRGFFPAFLLTIRLKLLNSGYFIELTKKIPFMKGEREILLDFLPERRGECGVFEIEISSPFPVAFFRRFFYLKENISFLVFPEPKKCQFIFENSKRKGENFTGEREGVSEFQGLSEFYPGIPKKFISWKSFAKWEELKRKLFSEEESPVLFIELKKLPLKDLEEKLSCATYLVLEAMERGYPVGIKLNGKTLPPKKGETQKIKILSLLAKYEELR